MRGAPYHIKPHLSNTKPPNLITIQAIFSPKSYYDRAILFPIPELQRFVKPSNQDIGFGIVSYTYDITITHIYPPPQGVSASLIRHYDPRNLAGDYESSLNSPQYNYQYNIKPFLLVFRYYPNLLIILLRLLDIFPHFVQGFLGYKGLTKPRFGGIIRCSGYEV